MGKISTLSSVINTHHSPRHIQSEHIYPVMANSWNNICCRETKIKLNRQKEPL